MIENIYFRDDNTKKWLINEKLKKYESKNTPMKKWRQNENLAILDFVASNLNMSGHNPTVFKNYDNYSGDDYNLIPIKSGHKDKARELISKTYLRQLYRGGPGRKVEKITIKKIDSGNKLKTFKLLFCILRMLIYRMVNF